MDELKQALGILAATANEAAEAQLKFRAARERARAAAETAGLLDPTVRVAAAADPRLGPPFPQWAVAAASPPPAPRRSITIPLPTLPALPTVSFQAIFNVVVVVVLLWHSGLHLSIPHVGPAPIPAPAPVPSPAIVGPIDVTYLVDGAATTPAQGAIRRSTTLRAALGALDASFHSYQSSDAEAAPFAASVQSAGLPCAVVTGPKGETLATLKAPAEADLVALVKSKRGK